MHCKKLRMWSKNYRNFPNCEKNSQFTSARMNASLNWKIFYTFSRHFVII